MSDIPSREVIEEALIRHIANVQSCILSNEIVEIPKEHYICIVSEYCNVYHRREYFITILEKFAGVSRDYFPSVSAMCTPIEFDANFAEFEWIDLSDDLVRLDQSIAVTEYWDVIQFAISVIKL